jgi:hypothetical protein
MTLALKAAFQSEDKTLTFLTNLDGYYILINNTLLSGIENRELIIDLGGKTLSYTNSDNSNVWSTIGVFAHDSEVTIQNGTVTNEGTHNGGVGFAISTNGLVETGESNNNCRAVTLHLKDLAVTQKTAGGLALYLPGYNGNTTIEDSTISAEQDGSTAVELRAGNLTVANTSIKGGSGEARAEANGSGRTTYNAALAIAQHTTKDAINVTINEGSTFTGGAAIYESNPQKNDTAAIEKINIISITSGTFTGKIYSEDKKLEISGGTFSEPVDSAYIKANFICSAVSGKTGYTVKEKTELVVEAAQGKAETNEIQASEITSTGTTEANKIPQIINDSAKYNVVDLSLVVVARNTDNIEEAENKKAELQNELKNATQKLKALDETVQEKDVNIFEQVYVVTTPQSYSVSEGYAVEITPYVKKIATKETSADAIVLQGDSTTTDANAVLLSNSSVEDIDVNTTVTISVPGFKDDTGNALIKADGNQEVWIKHTHGTKTMYYKAKSFDYNQDTLSYDVVFDNPDGFSTFTVFTIDSPSSSISINGKSGSISDVSVGMLAATETGKYVSNWVLKIKDDLGNIINTQTFTGSAFSQEAYNAVIEAYRDGKTIDISATFANNPTNTGSDTVSSKKDETVAADQTVEAEEAQTAEAATVEASAATSGDKNGTASKSTTKSATKNQKVTGEDSDAETVDDAAEEEQVAEVEESVVEDVAQAEDNDVTANEADGGAIAETAANSSHAWMWLIVVLACACAAAILFVVFKRRKEEA